MRTQDTYHVKHGERQLQGGKTIKLSKEEYLKRKQMDEKEPQVMRAAGKQGFSVRVQPTEGNQLSGVFTIVQSGERNESIQVTGRMNMLPVGQNIELQIMEYGDFSSLIVEYPDYNSLGAKLLTVGSFRQATYTNEPTKVSQTLSLPNLPFTSLVGRALIAVADNGDLLAYGLIADETLSAVSSL